jgi:type IV pilus assembly protein PilY1
MNSIATNSRDTDRHAIGCVRRPTARQRLAPAILALVATLLGGPATAVTIPDLPLQTGSAYPPANIMFILDDSGSMEGVAMPKDVSSDDELGDDIDDKSYVHNTIYYNPAIDYLPWMQADGSRYSGGTDYDDAYSHASLLSGSTDLSDGTQTFFVPKSADSDLDQTSGYYRYQIRKVAGELHVVRSDWSKTQVEGVDKAGCSSSKGRDWRHCAFVTPTGRTEASEMANFATWYSYHRTRIKVAKAGASEAFGQLGSNIRVGYDSIWNRNPYAIPVSSDGGLFKGSNRSAWFEHLQAANGNSGTPLKGALQRAGTYFENTDATGPWGPESGANQISCRQNFAILTTDGYWNNDSGYTAVGDVDGADGTKISPKVPKDPQNPGASDYTYAPASPYSDNFEGRKGKLYSAADTLADVAMHFWNRDLVSTLDNDVPTSTADPAFWQHMVTFGVSIGLQGRLDPKSDLPSITNGSKHWGDPTDTEDLDRIDDLWHASVNGHGNFVVAANPTQFAQGLIDALTTVAARLGSASNVTANSTSFQTDTRVYQASYVSGKWTGELAAYEVSKAGVSSVDANGDGLPDAVWQASKGIPATGRSIFTWDTAGATFPTAAQTTALDQGSRALSPVSGADNAAYIAGNHSKERRNNGKLRDRDSLLGDIADSSPIYVKDSETIFVGANDGMLHAIDAGSGDERFAYVPAGLNLTDLASLSDPQYVHRYFVDGPIAVSTHTQTAAKNYLVGALGRGGKGVFALDVTDPAKFGTSNVLWDATGSALGGDMGEVLGAPLIVKLNDGSSGVIVSNGINSANGDAVLFVIDLTTGTVLRTLDTGAGSDNGLSAPRGADVDGDGKVDYVYAGDLKGNLWKFDLHATTASDWAVANAGAPMFTATDDDGNAQPITAGVAIAREPSTNRIWVFVGTGSFMTAGDAADDNVQSIYGLIDNSSAISGRGALAERKILVATTLDNRLVRGFEAASSLPSGKPGWYIDLDNPTSGERVVSDPRVHGSVLLTASLIPPTGNSCAAGGSGYINAIDAFTGTSLAAPYFDVNGDGKYNASDKVASDGTVVPVGSVDVGVGMPTLPTLIEQLLVVGGSKGTLGSIAVNPQGGSPRRISWREILRD